MLKSPRLPSTGTVDKSNKQCWLQLKHVVSAFTHALFCKAHNPIKEGSNCPSFTDEEIEVETCSGKHKGWSFSPWCCKSRDTESS